MRELTLKEQEAVAGATSAADAWIATGGLVFGVGAATSETGLGLVGMAAGAFMVGVGVGLDVYDATSGKVSTNIIVLETSQDD